MEPLRTSFSLTNAPFVYQLTSKMQISIYIEDILLSDGYTFGFDGIAVTFASQEGKNLSQLLNRFQAAYPQVTWTLQGGVIILPAAALRRHSHGAGSRVFRSVHGSGQPGRRYQHGQAGMHRQAGEYDHSIHPIPPTLDLPLA